MIHDWWYDTLSPSLTSHQPARPPWRAHATKQRVWLVNTNIPITPLAGSLPSCTDGPISRKFWLVLWWSSAWQRRLTRSEEPPAMGNLATSGICSLAFIHYQKLVPTLITVWPHNINNCYFFSQKTIKYLEPEKCRKHKVVWLVSGQRKVFSSSGSLWSDLSVTELSGDCDASLNTRNVPKFPFSRQTSYKLVMP